MRQDGAAPSSRGIHRPPPDGGPRPPAGRAIICRDRGRANKACGCHSEVRAGEDDGSRAVTSPPARVTRRGSRWLLPDDCRPSRRISPLFCSSAKLRVLISTTEDGLGATRGKGWAALLLLHRKLVDSPPCQQEQIAAHNTCYEGIPAIDDGINFYLTPVSPPNAS
ncbi:hypothetical protein THAOC_03533 [Thalassiosira oceanica]|uniref:Uncharacterized protein n=1 Tax=Thalassiosira oceanica TaxID=159749 RepID=K0TCB1_THAOC|nr:hypothetical protein THAOC_03533 [Thalassiosira oceanica]|eukprot:EJK74774.1 hypothetical protein THAOC_03533 [Thalassiosira oceanica]